MSSVNYNTKPGTIIEQFHFDKSFVRVLLGPLGSGKTTSCCFEIMRRACQQEPDKQKVRKSRWLVVRNSVPELETTTLPSWRQHFSAGIGPWKMSVPITHSLRFALPDLTNVHCDVYFMGLDGPDAADKIRGMELTGAWVNEMRDVGRPVIDMLTGRVGRFPPRVSGGPTWYGIIGDTNMPDDDHWMYDLAEVKKPDGWRFFRQPGGVLKVDGKWQVSPNAENIDNLPQNYYQNQLAGKTEEWVRVYLAAEYGYVADGRPVYPEYSDIVHVAEIDPIDGNVLYIGCDFGLTPAAVIMQVDPMGRKLLLDEFVSHNVGVKSFSRGLKTFLAANYPNYAIGGMWGDPAGGKRVQTDEKTVFEIMKADGFDIRPAPGNNLYTIRREAVAATLTRLIDGKPGLIVNKRATKVRAGLAGKYCYRRINTKGDTFADRPDKNEWSHVVESLEYVCLGLGEGRQLVQEHGRPNLKRLKVITGTRHHQRVVTKRY